MSFGPLRLGAGHPQHGPGALLHTPVTDGFDVHQEGAILPSCHACCGGEQEVSDASLKSSKGLILTVKANVGDTFDQLGAG